MYNCIENYRHTQEKQPYNDNVEEIYPEFSTYFFCEQVTNILETSPPVVYALQRKVGQYLKAFQGTYIPGNPEKWWVFWHGHGFKRKLIFASSIFLRCKLLVSTRIRIGHKCCSDRSHRPIWGRETRWIRFGWQKYDLQILSIIDRQSEEPKCFSAVSTKQIQTGSFTSTISQNMSDLCQQDSFKETLQVHHGFQKIKGHV